MVGHCASTLGDTFFTGVTPPRPVLIIVTDPGTKQFLVSDNFAFAVYVDASDTCNELAFNLQEGTSTATRAWSIKITQYDCDYDNLAPKGCTQYHFGSTTGQVQTYNWDGGHHLAGQDQNICVR